MKDNNNLDYEGDDEDEPQNEEQEENKMEDVRELRKPTTDLSRTIKKSFIDLKNFIVQENEMKPSNLEHGYETLDLYDTVEDSTDDIFSAFSPDLGEGKWYNKLWNFIILESWLFLLLLGISSAIVIISCNYFITKVFKLRALILSRVPLPFAIPIWMAISTIFALMAAVNVYYVSPHGAGSGLPEMKAILSGVSMKHYLSFRTFVAKTFGLIGAVCAGLSIGRVGVYSHMCSIVANNMCRISFFQKIRENASLRLQMLACACSVAVAIGFGSPVGGVLYAIEVTSSFYNMQQLWKSFYCGMCGVLVIRLVGPFGLSPYFETEFTNIPYRSSELIAFIFLSVILGFVGVLFIKCIEKAGYYRKKFVNLTRTKYAQIIFMSLLTTGIAFVFPHVSNMTGDTLDDLFSVTALKQLPQSNLVPLYLVIEMLIKFSITVVTIGLPIPCGVFAPVFITGALFGRFFGEILSLIFPKSNIIAAGYAVVGASALTGGVTRSISTAVIVFEVTGQLNYVTPVLLSILITSAIGNVFCPSIFDKLIQIKKLPYLPALSKQTTGKKVDDFMQTLDHIITISKDLTYNELVNIVEKSQTRSTFPVVLSKNRNIFLGIISQRNLRILIHRREEEFERRVEENLQNQLNKISEFDQIDKSEITNSFKSAFLLLRPSYNKDEPYGTRIQPKINVPLKSYYQPYKEAIPLSEDRRQDSITDIYNILTQGKKKKKANKLKKRKKSKKQEGLLNEHKKGEKNQGKQDKEDDIPESEDITTGFQRSIKETFDMIEKKREDYDFQMDLLQEINKDLDLFLNEERYYYFDVPVEIPEKMIFSNTFTINAGTPITKCHFLFSMLSPKLAYIIKYGELLGVLTKDALVKSFYK